MPVVPDSVTSDLPSADDVRSYLDRHPPTEPSRSLDFAPLVALVLLVMAFLLGGSWTWIIFIVIWGLLIASVLLARLRNRVLSDASQQLTFGHELALLRQHHQSLMHLWRLLPEASRVPALHARCVGLIGYNLDQLKAYDSALAAYDYLIQRLPEDHPGSVQLRVQQAILYLLNEQLADADDVLRRLRHVVHRFARTAIDAAFQLALLIQCVRTNHDEEAVAMGDRLTETLRPLGLDAGFGHALLALSLHRMAQRQSSADAADATLPADGFEPRAADSWARATLLLPPAAIVHRFPELAPLRDDPRFPDCQLNLRGGVV